MSSAWKYSSVSGRMSTSSSVDFCTNIDKIAIKSNEEQLQTFDGLKLHVSKIKEEKNAQNWIFETETANRVTCILFRIFVGYFAVMFVILYLYTNISKLNILVFFQWY